MKIEGIYRWKLINKSSGKVEDYGEQKNLITDSIANGIFTYYSISKSSNTARIVLSEQSVPLPTAEYREYGAASSAISRDSVTGNLIFSYNDAACTAEVHNNFAPPGSSKTWTIFGLDWYFGGTGPAGWREFASFVILTTPITQTTLQYLYVSYTLYIYYSGALINGVTNNFVKSFINTETFENLRHIVYRYDRDDKKVYISPFTSPVTLSNVGRLIAPETNIIELAIPANYGCRYGQSPLKTFSTTEYIGPIGVPIWQAVDGSEGCVLGNFESNLTPSISRVYIHPNAYKTRIFSEAAHPPSSRGSIVTSGTPTNKVPLILNLEITKTGDASDIVDESFTTDYVTNDQLTVSQDDWAVNDIVQVSSTGTLPSPLVASTDYYIVSKIGSSPTVLIELSDSEGGSVIELTDDGSGTHTISRQNTGRYRLTMEPYLSGFTTNYNYRPSYYQHFYPMEDLDGNLLQNNNDPNPPIYYSTMCRYGDYIYSVHYNQAETRLMVCRQLMFTPECSLPLHSYFGTTGVRLRCVEMGKGTYANIAYIATDEGIYKYDLASPATPTLMSITGLLYTDVRDLSFDEVTEYLWCGHYQGLSRVDLSSNTATQYDIGSGNPLDGMSRVETYSFPGTITAHNGFVFFARARYYVKWLLEDGVGYCRFSSYGSLYGGGTLWKSNGYLILREEDYFYVLNITGITGPNTGSVNLIQSLAASALSSSYYSGQPLEVSDGMFMLQPRTTSFQSRTEVYDANNNTYYSRATDRNYSPICSTEESVLDPRLKNSSIAFDVSEGYGVLACITLPCMFGFGLRPFGWTGSDWELDNVNDRQIIKTGTHSVTHGVSVAFNNATGENWDDQFVEGEHICFVISPVLIKDNLQEYTIRVRNYYVPAKRVVNWSTTCAAQVRVPECPLGSSPDVDFRDLDWDLAVTSVYDVTDGVYLTRVSSPPSTPGDGEYSITGLLDGLFEFHANQVGHTIQLTYNYSCYW